VYRETQGRSLLKALSWRIGGTIVTAAIIFAATRRLALSLAIGGIDFFMKITLFWFHERVWDRIRFGKQEIKPAVIWFTGLSGSGKSTISKAVAAQLQARGFRVEQLDGDKIRDIFPNTGFTRPERDAHIKRVGYLASKLEKNGVFVVASFVSPYEESRTFVRGLCQNFVEVHVATPLEICEQRDVKGLYARARRGEIKNFTGIDDPYEEPLRPDIRIDTTEISLEDASRQVLSLIDRHVRNGGGA
jgi:adenylylsulfate kinase